MRRASIVPGLTLAVGAVLGVVSHQVKSPQTFKAGAG